jgi:hypothetical protein
MDSTAFHELIAQVRGTTTALAKGHRGQGRISLARARSQTRCQLEGYGRQGLGKWLERLELRNVITELAQDLYAFRDWDIGEYSHNEELNASIWWKYPGI